LPPLKKISILTLVNKPDKYQKYVLNSTYKEIDSIQYSYINWAKTAASALNYGLDNLCTSELIICCHQDVEFLPGWLEKILHFAENLPNWGVLGMAGTTFKNEMTGTHSGLGIPGDHIKVMTVDCSVIILKKSQGLRFDENLKYFHGYGEDIALQANAKGLNVFVIDVPIKHHTEWTSGKGFWESMSYLAKKWRSKFGMIHTTIGSH